MAENIYIITLTERDTGFASYLLGFLIKLIIKQIYSDLVKSIVSIDFFVDANECSRCADIMSRLK